MTNEEIINAIKIATNGTFIGEGCSSTLMGWTNIYDEQGRLVTCDPNYKESEINICGKNYKIIKKKWNVYIFKPEYFKDVHYTTVMAGRGSNEFDEMLIAKLDLTPDYVKEYWEKHEND